MPEDSKKNITIIGGGLAGSLLSVYLAKKGFHVDVYERRPDMRKEGIEGGRSINLALSTRGIHALKEISLYDEIKKICIPMYGRMIHSFEGKLTFQRYGKDDSEYINSVSRAELNKSLMNLAEDYDNVNIHFGQRCKDMDFETGGIIFHDEFKDIKHRLKPGTIIATDGSASAVRKAMLRLPGFNFSQEYENYGYKELNIPPGKNSTFVLEKNALHIWPRGSFMLIALPNIDGSFTCTLFLAYDRSLGEENSFENIDSEQKLYLFFDKQFPDVLEMMPHLNDEFFNNPTGSLITIKCYPWSADGKVCLLGDSCHAMVPFFGQGMNAAFEDCTYLNEHIGNFRTDWANIFDEFQKKRKPDTDAISELARENFIEMRDLVARPVFQLKKKIEAELQKKYPGKFIPKYSMVTFHRIPYSEALRRGKVQDDILNKLSSGINTVEETNWVLAEQLVNDL